MSKPQPMTPRRAEVLDYIISRYEEHNAPPTLREMMAHFGWQSTQAAHELLRKLKRHGFIEIHKGRHGKGVSRGIKVLRQPDGKPYSCPGSSPEERALRRARFLRRALPRHLNTEKGNKLKAVVWGEPVRRVTVALSSSREQAVEQLQTALESASGRSD